MCNSFNPSLLILHLTFLLGLPEGSATKLKKQDKNKHQEANSVRSICQGQQSGAAVSDHIGPHGRFKHAVEDADSVSPLPVLVADGNYLGLKLMEQSTGRGKGAP